MFSEYSVYSIFYEIVQTLLVWLQSLFGQTAWLEQLFLYTTWSQKMQTFWIFRFTGTLSKIVSNNHISHDQVWTFILQSKNVYKRQPLCFLKFTEMQLIQNHLHETTYKNSKIGNFASWLKYFFVFLKQVIFEIAQILLTF